MQDQNQKLKPCPFCGEQGELLHYKDDGYLPKCSRCDGMIEKWFKTKKEAADAWNNRKSK
jgi:hypothetical protein